MTVSDCAPVAALRVRGWRFAYRGLMPRAFLDALEPEWHAERTRERLARGGDGVDLVAERDGRVVGWVSWGPYRDGEATTGDSELYALYAEPDCVGTGVGRTLLETVLRDWGGRGRMLLWVVEGNTRARRFYERAGFRADGAREPYEAGGVEVPEVRYALGG
ncbi:GNAT family N-acetyltransferase [Streptomyces sp. J2-1]|nr:GNAT family N-acetyltransferase [Streptomyces corallincola]